MAPTDFLTFFIFFIFILFSGLYSSAETAITAINRVKLRSLIDQEKKGAKSLDQLLLHPRDLIISILIGNNLANISASVLATAITANLEFSDSSEFILMVAFVTGMMTFIILTFGEITPKTLALKNPYGWAIKIQFFLRCNIFIFKPFIILFNGITNLISKLFGVESALLPGIYTEEDIKSLIKISQEDGVIEEEEQAMIEGVINFSDKIVREIMTPRTDAVCIESTQSITDVVNLISEKGHSRIPVYETRIDNIIGVIYAKDLLLVSQSSSTPVKNYIREVMFIPETKNIEDLLHQMKRSQFHLAIAVDEHGGMAGLVTFEDIIEEIVGEIQDEYDKDDADLVQLSDHTYLVDAGLNIDDLSEELGLKFAEDEDYDTVGGFILHELGSLPKKDQVLNFDGFSIKVTQLSQRRILKVELTIIKQKNN